MKKKILYILALSHTGSTVLSLELAKAFGGIAIGESYHVFKHSSGNDEGVSELCSCDETLAACPFWKSFAGRSALSDGEAEWAARYKELLQHPLAEQASVVIDSSKKAQMLPILKELKDKGDADPFVIFLVRDVRGWVLSDRAAWQRSGGVAGARRKSFSLVRHFYSWLKGNAHYEDAIKASGLPSLTIGYEDFCFDHESVFERIRSVAGIVQGTVPGIHHIAYSNRMKMSSGKPVMYDDRWMRSRSVSALFALMPWIAKKNAEWVYPNTKRK